MLLSEIGHPDVGARVLETFLTNAPQSPDVLKAKLQLAEMQAPRRQVVTPDHYQVMGLQRTASSNDVCSPLK